MVRETRCHWDVQNQKRGELAVSMFDFTLPALVVLQAFVLVQLIIVMPSLSHIIIIIMAVFDCMVVCIVFRHGFSYRRRWCRHWLVDIMALCSSISLMIFLSSYSGAAVRALQYTQIQQEFYGSILRAAGVEILLPLPQAAVAVLVVMVNANIMLVLLLAGSVVEWCS